MFISYHLFYYMLAVLAVTLSLYHHPLFWVVVLVYMCWLSQRLSWKHVLVCLLLCLPLCVMSLFPKETPSHTLIEGVVKKVSSSSYVVDTTYGMVKMYCDEELKYQDHIEADVEWLDMNENTNDHAFNEKLYCYGQRIYYKAKIVTLHSRVSHKGLYHILESRLSQQTKIQDYQRLFLLGEKSDSIQEDYQQLSQLSLVHLFALSGMHVHILYTLLYRVISTFCSQRITRLLVYMMIGFYIFSIPMQVSLYRAFFTLVLYDVLKRYLNSLDIMSLLIMVSFYYNPYYIYNISFVFSYFVYFIVLMTSSFQRSYFWIYLSTIPLLLTLNYQFPLLSLWVSSFLMPFIEGFYVLCIMSVLFPGMDVLMNIVIQIFTYILQLLDALSIFFTFSKPSLFFISVFYCLYFMMIYRKSLSKSIQPYFSVLIALCLSFSLYSQVKIYGEITMIDVGQGDCLLIRLPFRQGNILIDTGGQKDYDLATQVIIPYLKSVGIQQLDYVYISHDDFDHCGALESLQEHFPVKQVIRDYEKERRIGSLTITMLEHKYSRDSNDQSLVMLLSFPGFQMLTLGDASVEVEKELYEKYHTLDVDLLKVSHHGSQTSTGVELLQMIQPRVAMIGVKKNNMYGHPSIQVIERLQRKNIMILRTDEDGMFHIRYDGHKYFVYR